MPPTGTKIVRKLEQLRRQVANWRSQGLRTALVPTMGALHDGHLTLVRQGLRRADRVVVTIFVNPKQFGKGEDLESYPRDETGDARKLKSAGANLIFIPETTTIYPEGVLHHCQPHRPRQSWPGGQVPAAFLRWRYNHRCKIVYPGRLRLRHVWRKGLSAA